MYYRYVKYSLNPFFIRSVIQIQGNMYYRYVKYSLNPFFIRSVIQIHYQVAGYQGNLS